LSVVTGVVEGRYDVVGIGGISSVLDEGTCVDSPDGAGLQGFGELAVAGVRNVTD